MKVGLQVFVVIISTWLVLSVFGNICFIIVVVKNNKLRNITNWLICNIALSDLILGAFAIPQLVHDISHTADYFEPAFLCRSVNALPIFCITSSIYSMAALSVERYRSIVLNKPLLPLKHATIYVIIAIWLFSLSMSIPTVVEFDIREIDVIDEVSGNMTLLKTCHQVISRSYSIANCFAVLFLSYIIPQVVVYTFYTKVCYFIWIKSKIQHGTSGCQFSTTFKTKIRVIKMLICAASLFTIAWIPYFTLQTIEIVTSNKSNVSVTKPMFLAQLVFSTFSTSYNVVLYVVYVKHYRKAFRDLLCPCLKNEVAAVENQATNSTADVTRV